MIRGIMITATDTGVGKTQVSAGLAMAIKLKAAAESSNAYRVALWKPVQTGVAIGDKDADSYRLAGIGGTGQSEQEIVSYTFSKPLAPWIAARYQGAIIEYDKLLEEGKQRLNDSSLVLVEGAGGLAIPLTKERLICDLARDLRLPVVIIARPGLGTVNHTVLTAAYAREAGLKVLGIILNGYHPDEWDHVQENVEMIEAFSEARVLGVLPWYRIRGDMTNASAWARKVEKYVNIDALLRGESFDTRQ